MLSWKEALILTLVSCLWGQCFALRVICYTAPLIRGHLISLGSQPRRNLTYKLDHAKFDIQVYLTMILSAITGGSEYCLFGSACWAEMRIWCHFLSHRFKSIVILKRSIDKQRLETANISLLVLIQSTCQTGAQTDPYRLHEWNETLKIKQSCKEEWLFNSMWNVSHQGHLRWGEGRRWRGGGAMVDSHSFFTNAELVWTQADPNGKIHIH